MLRARNDRARRGILGERPDSGVRRGGVRSAASLCLPGTGEHALHKVDRFANHDFLPEQARGP